LRSLRHARAELTFFQDVISYQRDIYLAFADHIKAFAAGGGWFSFLVSCDLATLRSAL
jgi:hypothetical protein